MVQRMFATLLATVLFLTFSTFALAQDAAKQEMKKESKQESMKKDETTMGPLKSVSCAPECGFMCRSHNEKELCSIVIKHAKTAHNKKITEKDVKAMMKTEEATETKKD